MKTTLYGAIFAISAEIYCICTSSMQHSSSQDLVGKSLALHVTSINLVSLERGSTVEYVFS